jgi:hypothetical protein
VAVKDAPQEVIPAQGKGFPPRDIKPVQKKKLSNKYIVEKENPNNINNYYERSLKKGPFIDYKLEKRVSRYEPVGKKPSSKPGRDGL